MKAKDYYKILGINKNATNEEIKKKYRLKCKQYHPDVSKEKDSEEKFKDISEAYSVLSDPEKRKRYDLGGTNAIGGKGFNPFDVFFNLNKNFMNKQASQSFGARASDNKITLEVDIKELYCEEEKVVKFSRKVLCKKCGGMGGEKTPCSECNGSGKKVEEIRAANFYSRNEGPCPKCYSSGVELKSKCDLCNGNGIIWEKKTTKVKLEQRFVDGGMIGLNHLGDEGVDGVGNLLLEIKVAPYKNFARSNNVLIYAEDIKLDDLLKGGDKEIELPNGNKVSVHYDKDDFIRLPEGTQIFRKEVKERGFCADSMVWVGNLIL